MVIGRASTDNLGVLLGPCAPCGKKWLIKPKSERNEIELRSFHQMAKLWPPKYWLKVAALLILSQLVAILATFFEICPLLL